MGSSRLSLQCESKMNEKMNNCEVYKEWVQDLQPGDLIPEWVDIGIIVSVRRSDNGGSFELFTFSKGGRLIPVYWRDGRTMYSVIRD